MRPAGERTQHHGRLPHVGRLPEQLTVEDDLGVDAQHGTIAAVDRARLARRALERIADGLLVERGRNGLEWDSELRQDRAALRRRRREDEWRRGHATLLRAAQISSQGHLRAQSAVT